jgi:hypothetical protein
MNGGGHTWPGGSRTETATAAAKIVGKSTTLLTPGGKALRIAGDGSYEAQLRETI